MLVANSFASMHAFRSLALTAACSVYVALGLVGGSSRVQAEPVTAGGKSIALAIPPYGDKSVWGIYVRRLQDTVAKQWWDEIFYYNYPSSITRGSVTIRYTFNPQGRVVSRSVISNTANGPFADRALAAVRKADIQAMPASILSQAPDGLTIVQTFNLRDNDPTDYGLASSYPQLLRNRYPDTGGAENLDLRRYYPLQRFIYQSRILSITAAG
jgi:TonB family protein